MPFVVTLLASLVVAAAPGGMQATELDERTWEAGIRDVIATRYGVPPEAPRFAPGKRLIAFVRTPTPPKRPTRRPPPPSRLLVVDPTGKLQASFPVVTMKGSHEPPADLRFLDDARLVYEAVSPPPAPEPPAKPAKPATPSKLTKSRGRQAAKAAPSPPAVPDEPAVPKRLFVIQPVRRGARAIRCEASAFAFSPRKDHLAYVAGAPDAGFVAIDGKRLYPRRGTTGLPSNVAWSPDAKSLAFLEVRAAGPRLVLEPDLEQPGSADTSWDLPPTFPLEGMKVFWAGPSRLVVGKSVGAPAFSTSFELERPAM